MLTTENTSYFSNNIYNMQSTNTNAKQMEHVFQTICYIYTYIFI